VRAVNRFQLKTPLFGFDQQQQLLKAPN
jgi:hypothetical protein